MFEVVMKKLIGILLLTVFLLLGAYMPQATQAEECANVYVDGRARVVELVNIERAKHGLKPVKWDESSALQEAAQIRAEEMTKKYAHERPDGRPWHTVLREKGISPRTAAENGACGTEASADDAMRMWMDSPGHKANILHPDLNKIGVGCAHVAEGDLVYWVQLFIRD